MKRLLTFLGTIFVMAGSTVWAQEVDSSATTYGSSSGEDATVENIVDYVPDVTIGTRFSYGQLSSGMGGFNADALVLDINGKISKNLSYSFNHSLHAIGTDGNSFLDALNWFTLDYELGNFTLTAGKNGLYVGSFEYDELDIDSYYDVNSIFYNNLSCWQWGASAMWTNNAETTSLAFQVATSPFSWEPGEDNLYSYNLAWYGAWDMYESKWSVNFMEYAPGEYMKMLALGNMFHVGDFSFMLDYMVRMANWKDALDSDYTLLFQPFYKYNNMLRVFAKVGVEKMADSVPYDLSGEYLTPDERIEANLENKYVMPAYITAGREYLFYGAGVEYFPLKDNRLRIHALWTSNNYTKRHLFNVGLTWNLDLTKAIKSLSGKARK